MSQSTSEKDDHRPVFFFDVDDCLYPRSLGVSKLMYNLLQKFVMDKLSLSEEEATRLNQDYFEKYTLSVIGLVKLHEIDPLEFNEENDGALPLNELLSTDPRLRATLLKFDRAKVKLWLFTNAYITHAQRVVKLLGVDDLFEGVTYCDYANGLWPLKPHAEMFEKAEREAGVTCPDQCYFVDDNARNCNAALARGWQVARIIESNANQQNGVDGSKYHEIHDLDELHDIFPQFQKS